MQPKSSLYRPQSPSSTSTSGKDVTFISHPLSHISTTLNFPSDIFPTYYPNVVLALSWSTLYSSPTSLGNLKNVTLHGWFSASISQVMLYSVSSKTYTWLLILKSRAVALMGAYQLMEALSLSVSYMMYLL